MENIWFSHQQRSKSVECLDQIIVALKSSGIPWKLGTFGQIPIISCFVVG